MRKSAVWSRAPCSEAEKNERAGGPWRRHRSEAAGLLTERQTWELKESQQDVANFVEET